ncbi:hypothetical protein Tco_1029760 [Tanacetum coccineum]|uniref:Uncharacterized protein n=1 Tax=Tanacetum coccineum TaxID=301880 RepID=A0ABQ5G629_9ASTR
MGHAHMVPHVQFHAHRLNYGLVRHTSAKIHRQLCGAAKSIPCKFLTTKEIHQGSRRNPPYQAKGGRVNKSFYGALQGREHARERSTGVHENGPESCTALPT